MITINARIRVRRDTSTNWQTQNPVLAEGELGYETDTGRLKVGNGVDHWNDLPYISGSGSGSSVSSFLDLQDTPSDYTGQSGKLVAVNSTEDGLEFTDPPQQADEKVKVSSTDGSEGYLEDKLEAGENITITKQTSGGNEKLVIAASVPSAGASKFTELTDTPSDYGQFAGAPLLINQSKDGITIYDPSTMLNVLSKDPFRDGSQLVFLVASQFESLALDIANGLIVGDLPGNDFPQEFPGDSNIWIYNIESDPYDRSNYVSPMASFNVNTHWNISWTTCSWVFGLRDGDTFYLSMFAIKREGTDLNFYVIPGMTNMKLTLATGIDDTYYCHVCAIADQAQGKVLVYKDGQYLDQIDMGTMAPSLQNTVTGFFADPQGAWTGSRFFTRMLTPEEIAALYNAEKTAWGF